MRLINTQTPTFKPSVVMLVYGEGGVGKTSFSSTAPKPILADCENGSKYFGMRGINMDVAQIEKWGDMKEFLDLAKSEKYETIILDPIGELMDKLKRYMIAMNDSKLVQKDGSPTMAGWGWLKSRLRDYIKVLRDTGKHIIIVAHIEEKDDEGRLVKRPKVETKLSDDLVNMVDIVAYMTVVNDGEESRRVLLVDPSSDKFVAKDRTGQLGKVIPPRFGEIVNACQGTEKYQWSKEKPVISRTEKERNEIEKEISKGAESKQVQANSKAELQKKLNKASSK
ncbi:MAG: ATP-binding protein [bacterium]